ncbi:6,7-dimethyl-8-ribityllumazine synthase [Halosimplex carlsbadense 2-9-1]|uniref:6,7-dimethyl-8-ribityllumazine synthase n=1 Tax=Halosimplex carlsbadense 2-9-1 TaxID=797114 RepID=M0D632_9EURY|nr:6,7-dimethyl-8-ribityllumazine synthase [Halosimplex carlsbadense]ELZ29599.1 6,7-dimethyl-8-ribityllumazine synthase [Halosimplex carlsbadense 2-9-1]
MVTLGLVVAEFYEVFVAEMEAQARTNADRRDAEVTERVAVPGVYDAPLAADRLARRDDIDAVVALGVVITGDTDHDRVVTHTAARQLSAVSVDRDTPVTFGVQGPNMSAVEARERIEKGARAVDAAVDLVEALPAVSGDE